MLNMESTLFRSILSFSLLLWCLYEIQLNSCNSNSCNSKDHLNRKNLWVPWTYSASCNSNFGFGVYFFHTSIFYCSKFECSNSNAIIFKCFEIFKLVWIRLLVADAIKMATKRTYHEVTLKVQYEVWGRTHIITITKWNWQGNWNSE